MTWTEKPIYPYVTWQSVETAARQVRAGPVRSPPKCRDPMRNGPSRGTFHKFRFPSVFHHFSAQERLAQPITSITFFRKGKDQ